MEMEFGSNIFYCSTIRYFYYNKTAEKAKMDDGKNEFYNNANNDAN